MPEGLSNLLSFCIVLAIITAMAFVWYMATKGMCNYTRDDGFPKTVGKHLLNAMTFGILGVTHYFQ